MLKQVDSPNYHRTFNPETGFTARWGVTHDDDPNYSPLGPEIADIEISVNGCPNASKGDGKGKGKGGCNFCVPFSTLIRTPINSILKEIGDLRVGGKVLGFDGQNYVDQVVEDIYSREVSEDLVVIRLEDGTELKCTGEHPVLVNGEYILAKNLIVGDDVEYYGDKDSEGGMP